MWHEAGRHHLPAGLLRQYMGEGLPETTAVCRGSRRPARHLGRADPYRGRLLQQLGLRRLPTERSQV